MKLFYITNARIPTEKAHGYQICKMCEEFSNAGVEVELWAPTRCNNIKEDVFSFYGIKDNFKIKKIKSFDFLRYNKILGQFSFYLQSLFFLSKLFFKKIDKRAVIYTRNSEIIWLFSLRGCKIILEAHSWPGSKSRLYKFLIKKVNKIIALTEGIKKIFINNGIDENQILVLPDGVDLNTFDINITKEQARIDLGLPKDKIILGYTGSFRTMGQDKGILDILKALKLDRNNYVNICFAAVGGSDKDIAHYRGKVEKLNLSDSVILLKRVDLNKLAKYQKAFDVLLMPFPYNQHYAYYMSPLKMFEYMASKRPIIASDLPSIREILNEQNSVLVEPDNSANLANGIKKILQDDGLADKISKQAFKDVQNYTWKKRAERILNFLKD